MQLFIDNFHYFNLKKRRGMKERKEKVVEDVLNIIKNGYVKNENVISVEATAAISIGGFALAIVGNYEWKKKYK